MYRVEDKYACSSMDFALLRSRIGTVLNPDGNQGSKEGYSVISVYFDDLYDTHLRDTVDGNSIREKYRIRIYDNSFDVIKLEVKYKRYNRVAKKSKNITLEQMQSLLSGRAIPDEGTPDDPAALFNIAMANRGLRPKVIVAYERSAYVYDAGNVRITFDKNIRSSNNIEDFGKTGVIYDVPRVYNAVLEIKYDEFLPGFIAGLLELGNMWQLPYSKYRVCRGVYMEGE